MYFDLLFSILSLVFSICKADEETFSRNPLLCSIEEGEGWKYLNSCYHIITQKMSWKDAENYCAENFLGHLVSISDEKADSFLKTVLLNYTENFWIGVKMRDEALQLWSSGWHVNYSNWGENQKHIFIETCGMVSNKGQWRLGPCFRELPFICETSKNYVLSQRISRRRRSNDMVPCEDGWFYYNEKCYKIGGSTTGSSREKLSWQRSRDSCKSLNSNLVTIENKEENDFVVGLLMLEVKDRAWIGLNDIANESDYLWVDGSTTKFTNWRENEPSGELRENEDCVHILVDLVQDVVGMWNDDYCDHIMGYICEKKSDSRKRYPNPRYCSSEDGDGFRYDEYCYHLVTVKKSWEEAEKHCVDNYKGHLLTVLDPSVDWFLHYLLQNLLLTELWIGIKMQDRYQQKWTSGWYVGYNGFDKEHRDFLEGTCVARTKRKQWSVIPCSNRYSFICEKSSTKVPVLKPPKDSYCPKEPEGWRDLDGESCYFIEIKDTATWNDASFHCMRKGGHLASLHSKDETELLHPFIKYTGTGAFIGLLRREGKVNTFAWADGSPVDFINWVPKEPNNENEKCVETKSSDMKWNDILCTDIKPYICSTKKIIKETTTEELEGHIDCPGHISVKAFIGVVVCNILLLILLGGVIFYFRRWKVKRRRNSAKIGLQPPSPAVNREGHKSTELKIRERESHYMTMDQ